MSLKIIELYHKDGGEPHAIMPMFIEGMRYKEQVSKNSGGMIISMVSGREIKIQCTQQYYDDILKLWKEATE